MLVLNLLQCRVRSRIYRSAESVDRLVDTLIGGLIIVVTLHEFVTHVRLPSASLAWDSGHSKPPWMNSSSPPAWTSAILPDFLESSGFEFSTCRVRSRESQPLCRPEPLDLFPHLPRCH